MVELVRRSLAGEKFLPARQAFVVERNLPHGPVQAVLGTLRCLGLDSLLARQARVEKKLAARPLRPRSRR